MNQRNIDVEKQKHQMTQEELQRTQVLNLQELEEVVRIERITSKKPAIIVALIGAFAIVYGMAFPISQSLIMSIRGVDTQKATVEKKRTEDLETVLNCAYTSLNQPDAVDTSLNVQFTFNRSKLIKSAKLYTVNPSVGNPLGVVGLQNYIAGSQGYLNIQVAGYKINATSTEAALSVYSEADLTVFNPTTLPTLHQSNVATSVDYQVNTTKDIIYNDMTTKGYICQ